jgi:hypothetical protein
MKKRVGFVSNSSSSSFIVAFDKKLEEYEDDELKMILFQTADSEVEELNTDELLRCVIQDAQEVFLNKDLSFNNPDSYEENFCFPVNHWDAYEIAEISGAKFDLSEGSEYQKIIKREEKRMSKEKVKEFLKDIKKRNYTSPHYYYFSFSDNDGEVYCYLEHAGIFERLPYMMENHH